MQFPICGVDRCEANWAMATVRRNSFCRVLHTDKENRDRNTTTTTGHDLDRRGRTTLEESWAHEPLSGAPT